MAEAGKPFAVRLPLTLSDSRASTVRSHAVYRLLPGQRDLILTIEDASSYDDHPRLIPLRTRYSAAGSFVGRSGLGVKVQVQKRQDEIDELALLSAPQPDMTPANEYLPSTPMTVYLHRLESAVLASDLEAIIEGKIASLPSGKISGCSHEFYEADVRIPVDVRVSKCWIGANVTRIAFRQKSNGKVLHEWNELSH